MFLNVCSCSEEMTTNTKKLPCGHIFHTSCLRSWFQRQQTCPTCRLNILRTATPPNAPAAAAGAAGAAAAAAGANGVANIGAGDAAAAAAAAINNNNNIPPQREYDSRER